MGRGISIENSQSAWMNDLESKLRFHRRRESLARSGEDDQSLTIRKGQKLIDVAQVALGQMRKRGAEDKSQPTSGILLRGRGLASVVGLGKAEISSGPTTAS